MDDIKDLLRNYRRMGEEEQVLFKNVADKIEQAYLTDDEIIALLSDITTDFVQDILKTLLANGYLAEAQYDYINEELKKIYIEEYIRDIKTDTWLKRLNFKTDVNRRLLTKDELLILYFSKTLEDKNLLTGELLGDEFLDPLIQAFKPLSGNRKSNQLYDKLKSVVGEEVDYILYKIDKKKLDL